MKKETEKIKEEKIKDYRAVRFGNAIKDKRKELGMTQFDLSVKSGLTQPVIARIEKGKIRNPQERTLEALSEALGIDLLEIRSYFGIQEAQFTLEEDEYGADAYIHIPKNVRESKRYGKSLAEIYAYVRKLRPKDLSTASYIIQGLYAQTSNKAIEEVAQNQFEDYKYGIAVSSSDLATMEAFYNWSKDKFDEFVDVQRNSLEGEDLFLFENTLEKFLETVEKDKKS